MKTWNEIEAEVELLFADKPRLKRELLNLIAKLEGRAFDHVQLGDVMEWFGDCTKDEAAILCGNLIAYASGAAGLLIMRFELHHEGKVVELNTDEVALSLRDVKDLNHPELGLVPDFVKSTYIYFSPGPGVPTSDAQGVMERLPAIQ
jgi:hypothetical protein